MLDCDVSDCSIGSVIQQFQDGALRVITYASRALSEAERRYCITRRELLAVVYGLKKFRQHLLGRSVVVRTDHAALTYLMSTPEPIGQQGRWLDLLAEYDIAVQHRPGRVHGNTDALSRRPCERDGGSQCRQCRRPVSGAVDSASGNAPTNVSSETSAGVTAMHKAPIGASAGVTAVQTLVTSVSTVNTTNSLVRDTVSVTNTVPELGSVPWISSGMLLPNSISVTSTCYNVQNSAFTQSAGTSTEQGIYAHAFTTPIVSVSVVQTNSVDHLKLAVPCAENGHLHVTGNSANECAVLVANGHCADHAVANESTADHPCADRSRAVPVTNGTAADNTCAVSVANGRYADHTVTNESAADHSRADRSRASAVANGHCADHAVVNDTAADHSYAVQTVTEFSTVDTPSSGVVQNSKHQQGMPPSFDGGSATVTAQDISLAQAADDCIKPVLQLLESGANQPTGFELRKYPEESRILFAQWDSLLLQNDILYRKFQHADGNTNFLQVILPVSLRHPFVERLHADLGHCGQTKTAMAFARRAYFPAWRRYVRLCVRNCSVCNLHQRRHQTTRQAPLQPMTEFRPMAILHADLVGPLPE